MDINLSLIQGKKFEKYQKKRDLQDTQEKLCSD